MQIKCPRCGSVEYECYDEIGGDGQDILELCVCMECDCDFHVHYRCYDIEED